jgi:hypothetical protein
VIVRPSGKNRFSAKPIRQCGPAPGAVMLPAALLAVYGTTGHWTEAAIFVAAGFAFAGLLATRSCHPGGRAATSAGRLNSGGFTGWHRQHNHP